jgi:ABC-2 type transport system permease protein
MRSVLVVFRKEMADNFSSIKFIILLGLVYISGAFFAYTAINNIMDYVVPFDKHTFLYLYTIPGIKILSMEISFKEFLNFFFIPIFGIIFGFDAINSEKNSGNLSRLLSQPIYRDSIINGKFLAGITTLTIVISSIVLIISGIGLFSTGVPPSSEDILRIFSFIAIGIFYGTFWMGLSILFSVIMEKLAASILTSIAIWFFLLIFIFVIPNILFSIYAPSESASTAEQIRIYQTALNILRISPIWLFYEVTSVILIPNIRVFQPTVTNIAQGVPENPLSLGQSLIQVWPQVVAIIAIAIICFALSYIIFMRQEIRST